ncbi:MAG TPA: DUF4375 domain-containing protein [Pirellulales bacterium]
MPRSDFRCEMTNDEFAEIEVDADDPLESYYVPLIDENERIESRFLESEAGWDELTQGQRFLIRFGNFDSQVNNGGLTQFFWNSPESIFAVADDLERLGVPELFAPYVRAVETLVGKKDRWLALRETWASSADDPQWEAFRESYGVLDLGWFDDAYFDTYGRNEQGKRARLARGWNFALQTRLADYIRSHRDEFITG